MNVKLNGKRVHVTLSRRNATQLIEALDRGFTEGLIRRCEDGSTLSIVVEEDKDHYGDRKPGPGIDAVIKHDLRRNKAAEVVIPETHRN